MIDQPVLEQNTDPLQAFRMYQPFPGKIPSSSCLANHAP